MRLKRAPHGPCDYLHEAIAEILRCADRPCTTGFIAQQNAKHDLWRRPTDGCYPNSDQVASRVNRSTYYGTWFIRSRDRKYVLLADWALEARFEEYMR